MRNFSFALLATFALFACNDNSVEEKDTSLKISDSAFKPVTPLTIADTLLSDNEAAPTVAGQSNTTSGNQTVTIQNPAVTQAVSSVGAKTGLNPAHGQPGHRCDIAVGAPLNSPPNTGAAPAVTQSSPATITPVSPTVAPKAAPGVKLNPPHGEPGHDCSVQVGAPLKG